MLLGYNTNGLADHDLPSAIRLVADLGYQCVAITLDHHRLNPFDPNLPAQLESIRQLLAECQVEVVVETGARYLLDDRRKHHPTLVTAGDDDRQRRVDFLRRSIDIAAELNAKCVSFWSGATAGGESEPALLARLAESLRPVIEHAAEQEVTLAFEPEPGHVIDTMESYASLLDALPADLAEKLLLTIDIGHLHCQGETPIADHLRTWRDRLANVHIEDMRAGVHEHLMFGEGEIDFPPVLASLKEINFAGPVAVELPRHSHMGPVAAEQSLAFLKTCL